MMKNKNILLALALIISNNLLGGNNEPLKDRTPAEKARGLIKEVKGKRYKQFKKWLKAGAYVDAIDSKGETPLFEAARTGHLHMVEDLVNHGANVNYRNKQGASPLFGAVENGHLNVVKFLLEHSASPRAMKDGGDMALDIAVRQNDHDMVRTLLAHGADDMGDVMLNETGTTGNPNTQNPAMHAILLQAKEKREKSY